MKAGTEFNSALFDRARLLLRRWREVIDTVEQGYEMSIYDYENDLATREELNEVLAQVEKAVASSLKRELLQADDHFIAVTRLRRGDESGRVWTRIPLLLVGELREDVEKYEL